MKINGKHYRSIWRSADGANVKIIDQTRLPHELSLTMLRNLADACHAIFDMQVRGAPLIGATAAYGICLGLKEDASDAGLKHAYNQLLATRPTAVNLRWALDWLFVQLSNLPPKQRLDKAWSLAEKLCDDDVATNSSIGDHGLSLIQECWDAKGQTGTVNILTHCNAGWIATVDWGTALSSIYKAHDAGIPVHIWVDETRPRNQGANLTAWELGAHGVPHHVIVDNAGGHLMQKGEVDMCIVGTDRTTAQGDVCNKIGTYLKALAANDNQIPFYVALPSSTIDWSIDDGFSGIPIEERSAREVTHIQGKNEHGQIVEIQLPPDESPAGNPAFDVTPARLVSKLITERGVCDASKEGLRSLFPEHHQ